MSDFDSISFHDIPISTKIEGILERSVKLFEQTGLDDLAQKWDTILSNYQHAKE